MSKFWILRSKPDRIDEDNLFRSMINASGKIIWMVKVRNNIRILDENLISNFDLYDYVKLCLRMDHE